MRPRRMPIGLVLLLWAALSCAAPAAALHRAFTVAYGPDKLRPAIAVPELRMQDPEQVRDALAAALSDAAADAGRLLAAIRST